MRICDIFQVESWAWTSNRMFSTLQPVAAADPGFGGSYALVHNSYCFSFNDDRSKGFAVPRRFSRSFPMAAGSTWDMTFRTHKT